METKTRKVRIAEAEGRREEGKSRKEARREGREEKRKEKTKERKENEDAKDSRRVRNMG